MERRIQKIKKIQHIQDDFLTSVESLFNLAKKETNKEFKKMMLQYVKQYSAINLAFSLELLKKFPKSYELDMIDKKFEKLMKPLAKEFKKKKKGK